MLAFIKNLNVSTLATIATAAPHPVRPNIYMKTMNTIGMGTIVESVTSYS